MAPIETAVPDRVRQAITKAHEAAEVGGSIELAYMVAVRPVSACLLLFAFGSVHLMPHVSAAFVDWVRRRVALRRIRVRVYSGCP